MAVKLPDACGVCRLLPTADQFREPDTCEVELKEKTPVLGGVKLGDIVKPPPEAWVPLGQVAVALALEALENGTPAVRVTAGLPFFFFFFFASAATGERAVSATKLAIASVDRLGRPPPAPFPPAGIARDRICRSGLPATPAAP
jgi:hypothetical protein